MVPKFRAWDETQHKMLQVDCIEFIDGKAYWVEASPADGNVQGGNDGPVGDNSQLKLEQSTGLKDANGKEIYEGDIVRMQRPGFHEHACYEVKYFVQDVCIFQIVKVTDGSTLFESPSNGHDVEVVGNVHTNPELLEAQHGN